jgi:two-component system sensor histidine kinase VicK
MQKEFINTAAHELRTPIQPILGISSILKKNLKDDKQKELLDVIARNARRLKKLSEDVLDVLKIESNLLNLNKEHFAIKELIQNIINNYKNELQKNINITFMVSDDFFIYADKIRISQVISKLINNSIKFSSDEKEEGKISIIVKKKTIYKNNSDSVSSSDCSNSHMVVIMIKDNGIGIDEETLPGLFTKFTTTSFQGIGLGLFISNNIIEAHGGRIWAENNKDGEQGATFSFSLPIDSYKNN